MNRKEIFFTACIFLLVVVAFVFSSFGLVSAVSNSTINFKVDIFAPPAPVVRLSLPDNIYLGNVSKGTETEKVKVEFNNTGTVAIIITPQLNDNSENIFNYTYFARRTTDSYQRVGSWSMNVSAPGISGIEGDYFYAKLDLRNYPGNFTSDVIGYTVPIKIFAVSQ
ncbi:MAG: hypothetical protein Q7R87_01950 [Nanoarchaeota archaeon]|nr:hypothetical protein [Nanoarchaeota archaeon]